MTLIYTNQDRKYWQSVINRIDLDQIRQDFDRLALPDRMWDGVEGWIMHGRKPGSFLSGILFDHPVLSVVPRADSENYSKLLDWCYFVSFLHPGLREDHWPGVESIQDDIAQYGMDLLSKE